MVIEDDPEVAEQHATLTVKDGQYLLVDRGAAAGTYLNDTRVTQEPLGYGDRIRLGQTVVLFVPSGRSQKDGRSARRLANLLLLQEVNKALNSENDLTTLLDLIMDTAIHLIAAERGFLIAVQGEQLEFRVARNIDYKLVQSPEFKISNSVIRKVVRTGEPILTSNAQHDLRDMKSIAGLEVRSLMCVPLKVKSKVTGTVYLDSTSRESQFDEDGRELLMAFADQAAIAMENARGLAALTEKEAILSELRVANRIQSALLPRHDPEVQGLEVSGQMVPAKHVGGDYFDYIWGPSSKQLYVAVGDVSGKGVPAGLVMVMARSILRSLAGRGALPRDLLREGNRLLKQDLKPGMFMSLLLAYVDCPTGRILLAGCGQERPLVYRAQERRVERIDLGGLVLGVVPDIGPHIDEQRVVLAPGDQIIFYSDGVTEATDPQRGQFGVERLEGLLLEYGTLPPAELVPRIVTALHRHAAGSDQHDDITIVALRRRLDG